jgi:hypothetical protein
VPRELDHSSQAFLTLQCCPRPARTARAARAGDQRQVRSSRSVCGTSPSFFLPKMRDRRC